jgi:hypothetical protein
MRLLMLGGDAGRAVAALIACHARIASIPFEQIALTLTFDLGRAMARAARRALGLRESQHAAL